MNMIFLNIHLWESYHFNCIDFFFIYLFIYRQLSVLVVGYSRYISLAVFKNLWEFGIICIPVVCVTEGTHALYPLLHYLHNIYRT